MNELIVTVDHLNAVLDPVEARKDAVPESPLDVSPRVYKALAERPADFAGVFQPPRRQRADTTPTYFALKERPADLPGLFVSPRRRPDCPAPTYFAMAERPADKCADQTVESALQSDAPIAA